MKKTNINRLLTRSLLAAAVITLVGCAGNSASSEPGAAISAQPKLNPQLWPEKVSAHLTTQDQDAIIERLLSSLSLEEKVGQMIQGDISTITPEDLRTYPLGSVLAGGNSAPGGNDRASATDWLALADAFYLVSTEKRAGHVPLPLLFGIDAVHGHNNIPGATLFPHNIGLGATRDPELVRRIGEATSREVKVTGLDWSFAPTLAVARDDRWGRTYESYSESPDLVASMAAPIVIGLQGALGSPQFLGNARTLASIKHFLGDGGTHDGHDQGDTRISEEELIRLHLAGYPPAMAAGALTLMVSFSSWEGQKLSGNKTLLTDILKNRMGWEGLVVSDWNAHSQVAGCTRQKCAAVFNAGIDMVMAADCWKDLYENTVLQARSGEIPQARIDDAVRRILRVKLLSGVLDEPQPSQRALSGHYEELGSPAHRALAREAARRSLVLLKNNNALLPLKRNQKILVAGRAADDIGRQAGGWTISWQGTGNTRADFPGATSILDGIRQTVTGSGGQVEFDADGRYSSKPEVAIVVFGEEPYAEYHGDIDTLKYQPGNKRDLALLKRLRADGIPVISVFLSGRPLWVNAELNVSQAFVAAWLPGSEGAAIADVIFRNASGGINFDFSGKLSFSWPRAPMQTPLNVGDDSYDPLFPFGYGLSYASPGTVGPLSEDPGQVQQTVSEIYFGRGRATPPWALYLSDAKGEARLEASRQSSPAATLKAYSVDALVQEDAKALEWSGAGEASLQVKGATVDLRRAADSGKQIVLRYRVDVPPTMPVQLALGCKGAQCAAVNIAPLMDKSPVGKWATLKIGLECFSRLGANLAEVDQPLKISTTGKFAMSFTDMKLDSPTADSPAAACPSP